MFFDQIDRELSETVAIGITVENRSENQTEIRKPMRGSISHAVLQTQVHHVAEAYIQEVVVGEERRSLEDRQQLHNGLYLLVGHEWQVGHALDGTVCPGFPHPLIFTPHLLPRCTRPQFYVRQTQAL